MRQCLSYSYVHIISLINWFSLNRKNFIQVAKYPYNLAQLYNLVYLFIIYGYFESHRKKEYVQFQRHAMTTRRWISLNPVAYINCEKRFVVYTWAVNPVWIWRSKNKLYSNKHCLQGVNTLPSINIYIDIQYIIISLFKRGTISPNQKYLQKSKKRDLATRRRHLKTS